MLVIVDILKFNNQLLYVYCYQVKLQGYLEYNNAFNQIEIQPFVLFNQHRAFDQENKKYIFVLTYVFGSFSEDRKIKKNVG